MASAELDQLLGVLKERSIDLNKDDVGWIFDSQKTKGDAKAWVNEYLSPHSLLTREEHEFYLKQGVNPTRGTSTSSLISDESYESAIEQLEASTASIEKQCQLLEAQKRALEEIKSRNGSDRSHGAKTQRTSKLAREKAQIDFEIAELSGDLQTLLQKSITDAENATGGIQSNVDRVLEKDDRLLDNLEKIVPQIANASGGTDDLEDVERLCQTLAAQTSAEIHTRLDSAYTRAFQDYGKKVNGMDGYGNGNGAARDEQQQQRDSLRAELEELCREIDGLSTMAVDNQYRSPISRALKSSRDDAKMERSSWTEYTLSALQYLVDRTETTSNHFENTRAHSNALKSVMAAVEAVIATGAKDKKRSSQRDRSQSPTKSLQKGLKPLRLVQANLSDSQDPVTQLLRHLDVRVPNALEASQLSQSLVDAVTDKNEKLVSLAENSEQTSSEKVAKSLVKVDRDLQDVLGAVLTHSAFGGINLINEASKKGTEQLEESTQALSEEMRELDLDDMSAVVRKKQQSLLTELSKVSR